MRPARLLPVLLLLGLMPGRPWAEEDKLYANIVKLDGTIMVERAKDQKKEALQTGSIVERGDVVTVYEKSWVILKTPKGDMIGLDSLTKIVFDELFKAGPDRQVRITLQRGALFLKSKNSKSRQSYFEVVAGNLVASLQRVKTLIRYEPKKSIFAVHYYDGKMTVIDPAGDQGFPFRDCKRIWDKGQLTQEDPLPLEQEDIMAFKDFWQGTLPSVR